MEITPYFVIALFATTLSIDNAHALGPAHSCWPADTRQDVMDTSIGPGNAVRQKSWFYRAPAGYKICFATTNEMSANPKNKATKNFFNKQSNSSQFGLSLPCPGDGVPLNAVGFFAGALSCGLQCGGVGMVGGQVVAEVTGQRCGVGGTRNSYNGNVVFILLPDTAECPTNACQAKYHPAPFEKF